MTEEQPPSRAEGPAFVATTRNKFIPAVAAASRVGHWSRHFFTGTEKHFGDISAAIIQSVSSEDDLDVRLRVQSCLMDELFHALLLKSTSHGLNEDSLNSALRTQRQYRQTFALIEKLKNTRKQTDKSGRKS